MEIAIAMILSDGGLSKTSNDARMKIEQGYKQEEYVNHLFMLFKDYCFTPSGSTSIHYQIRPSRLSEERFG